MPKSLEFASLIFVSASIQPHSGFGGKIDSTPLSAARSDSTPPRFAKTSLHPSPLPASLRKGREQNKSFEKVCFLARMT
jgi:hypothetical protein